MSNFLKEFIKNFPTFSKFREKERWLKIQKKRQEEAAFMKMQTGLQR